MNSEMTERRSPTRKMTANIEYNKMITTTQSKIIKRLELLATKYKFDLVSEKMTSEKTQERFLFMLQEEQTFKTVLGVHLHFYEDGIFSASVGSKFSILPEDERIDFKRIYPTQGDRISEVLETIEIALQKFRDTEEKTNETS